MKFSGCFDALQFVGDFFSCFDKFDVAIQFFINISIIADRLVCDNRPYYFLFSEGAEKNLQGNHEVKYVILFMLMY